MCIGGAYSDEATIEFGVCQGTTLGPILFNLYINDLCTLNVRCSVYAFADDTALVFQGQSWDEVYNTARDELMTVKNWLNRNLLTLNKNKTVYLTFSARWDGQPHGKTLQLHDCNDEMGDCTCTELKHEKQTKYLGVIVDCRLRWHQHTQHLTRRLRQLVFVFVKLRNVLDRRTITMVYYSLVQSLLQYGLLTWGGAAGVALDKVRVTQNLILRIILRARWQDVSTDLLYRELGVMDLAQLYLKHLLIYTHKHADSMLTLIHHGYDTRQRQSGNVRTARVHQTLTGTHAGHVALSVYNRLPDHLRAPRTVNAHCYGRRVTAWVSSIGREGAQQMFTRVQ